MWKKQAKGACKQGLLLPLIHLGLISVLLITLSLRRFLLKFAISLSLFFKLEERRKTFACEIFCECLESFERYSSKHTPQ